MVRNWSPEGALDSWKALDASKNIARLQHRFDTFPDGYLPENPGLVVDVAGGAFGGALHIYRAGQRRVLADLLVDEFITMDRFAQQFALDGIEPIKAEFTKLPFDDNSVDVLFTWEVYDHADDEDHFFAGIDEALRVLKGVWFLYHPVRTIATPGHPTMVTGERIASRINPVWEHWSVDPETPSTREYWAIVKK